MALVWKIISGAAKRGPPHSFDFAQPCLPAGRDGEPVEPLADVLYLEMVPLRLVPLDQHPHRPKGTLGGGHNPVN